MTHDTEGTNGPAGAGPLERMVGQPANDGTEPACKHPNKVEKHFTYGYRMHCPDCKHSEESWWD